MQEIRLLKGSKSQRYSLVFALSHATGIVRHDFQSASQSSKRSFTVPWLVLVHRIWLSLFLLAMNKQVSSKLLTRERLTEINSNWDCGCAWWWVRCLYICIYVTRSVCSTYHCPTPARGHCHCHQYSSKLSDYPKKNTSNHTQISLNWKTSFIWYLLHIFLFVVLSRVFSLSLQL